MKKLLLLLFPALLCGQVVIDTVLKLPYSPWELLYVPEENKLYINTGSSLLLVLDCETYQIRSTIPTHGYYPCAADGVWNWRRNKIYYVFNISPESIAVIDARADTVIKWIPFQGNGPPCYVSSNDRVYTAYRSLYVIDCESDSLIELIPPQPDEHFGHAFLDSVGNKVYVGSDPWVNPDLLMAYSCVNDSLVARVHSRVADPWCMVFNTNQRKAYIQGFFGTTASVIDTKADTLIRTYRMPYDGGPGVWNSIDDKVYMVGDDTLNVIDCATDSVIKRLGDWFNIARFCWAPWSNRLYVACHNYLAVLDCRNDTIIVPRIDVGQGPDDIVCDEANQRVYLSCCVDSTLYVFKDEQPGIQEGLARTQTRDITAWPNPFQSQTTIRTSRTASCNLAVYDISGHRIRNLTPGPAVIWDGKDSSGRQLPPGVYFVRLRTQKNEVTNARLILVR